MESFRLRFVDVILVIIYCYGLDLDFQEIVKQQHLLSSDP